MTGLTVFTSLNAALRAGYHIYDRSATGYVVRIRTSRGFALAIVDLKNSSL